MQSSARLLAIFSEKKELNDRHKSSLHNTYIRFIDSLTTDAGLVEHYFPGKEGGLGTLSHFQQLLQL